MKNEAEKEETKDQQQQNVDKKCDTNHKKNLVRKGVPVKELTL